MDVCKGLPHNAEQGYAKPCPIRHKCWRYSKFIATKRPAGARVIQGPYDFDDEECGKFTEL